MALAVVYPSIWPLFEREEINIVYSFGKVGLVSMIVGRLEETMLDICNILDLDFKLQVLQSYVSYLVLFQHRMNITLE